MSWFPLLSPPAPLVAYQHKRGRGKSSFIFDIQIAYLTRKQKMMEKSNNLLLEHNVCQLKQKNHSKVFDMPYNMRILPYLSPCCAVLAARFSNLTIFECSHRRHVITYTNDIFNNKWKRPHYATRNISNLYIENKYHQLTLQKKSDYFWTRVYRFCPVYGRISCET